MRVRFATPAGAALLQTPQVLGLARASRALDTGGRIDGNLAAHRYYQPSEP